MPAISNNNHDLISELYKAYQALPWYKKWFYPKSLRLALVKYNASDIKTSQQAVIVCDMFLNRTWRFQRFFFSSLANFNPLMLAYGLEILHNDGLLTGEAGQANREALVKHAHPWRVADGLNILHNAGLLTGEAGQANREAVIKHAHPWNLVKGLSILHNAGLLTGEAGQANCAAVVRHPNPLWLANGLYTLHNDGLLTGEAGQANRDALTRHLNPLWLANSLNIINNAGLLNGLTGQNNRDALTRHPNSVKLADTLEILYNTGLLTSEAGQNNFEAVVKHAKPENLFYGIDTLYKDEAGLLTGEAGQNNFEAVLRHNDPWKIARSLLSLHYGGLLTGNAGQANRGALVRHPDLKGLVDSLEGLYQAGLLTDEARQANFEALLRYTNLRVLPDTIEYLHEADLLTGEAGQANFEALMTYTNTQLNSLYLWDRVPRHLLNQDVFNQMITLTAQFQDNPVRRQRAFAAFINHLLGIVPGAVIGFNPGQSTHTASVHASVSESAKKLWQSYSSQLSSSAQLTKILKTISAWINSQPEDTIQQKAAKTCFNRLSKKAGNYIDSISQVSTKQLLALSWLAIHDNIPDQKNALEDRKATFIQGLYEIQRGYNLTDTGVDQGGDDLIICSAGTFNKLMEKLVSIHPDVGIIFISEKTIAVRLPKIVNQAVKQHLNALNNKSALTDKEVQELQDILANGITDSLWNSISGQVSSQLWAEFGSSYKNKDSEFNELVQQGLFVELSDSIKRLLSKLLNAVTATSSSSSSFFQPEKPEPSSTSGSSAAVRIS